MIYLDYNATTPVDQHVVDVMNDMHMNHFGNPSSVHNAGAYAADMMDETRKDLAITIGANMMDVVFTSGATEANNMIISSFGKYLRHDCRILYGATEHKSVIEPCVSLTQQKIIDAKSIPVRPNGTIDPEILKMTLKEYPADMVSIMLANSETGVINPIRKIAKIVHAAGAILHSDITQAVGKIPVDIAGFEIDVATCSSHKVYGPKGCGALVATRNIRRTMLPLILGGGQENNLRSGTQNVPAIVGFGKACEIARLELPEISEKIMMLRDNFESGIKSAISDIVINGETAERLPNTSNIRIKGVLANAVIANVRNIAISSGSACSSSTMEPSHVLLAMGLDRIAADECIRISVGKYNTIKDIEKAVTEITRAVEFIRKTEAETVEKMHNVTN